MQDMQKKFPQQVYRFAITVFVWLGLVLAPFTLVSVHAAPKSPKLFGTVEFRGSFKNLPTWQSVLKRNEQSPLLKTGAILKGNVKWDDLKAKLSKMPVKEQIAAVNSFWNQWPYRQDPDAYGKPDYWAIPKEFHKTSGDCEDYAIAKYYTLKELGFPIDKMRIVVVKELIRNIAHAILAVYVDDQVFILDNLSRFVLPQERIKNYAPQFSVNEKFRWAHVRPKR